MAVLIGGGASFAIKTLSLRGLAGDQALGIFDVDFAYQATEAIRVLVGANNVLNTYPDIVQPGNRGGANPFSDYNQYSPFGIGGGFYYAKLNVTF